MDEDKPEPLLILFDFPFQEGSVYVVVFIETQAITTDEHAGHISFLFYVLCQLPIDRLQKLQNLLRGIDEKFRNLDWEILLTIVLETNIALINAKSFLFF